MSRPHSPEVLAALADMELGLSGYKAAIKHGVSRSTLSRAKKAMEQKKLVVICPACDHQFTVNKGEK